MTDFECIVTGTLAFLAWLILTVYLWRTQPPTIDQEYDAWIESLKNDLNTYAPNNINKE